jgi:hypothetical protein
MVFLEHIDFKTNEPEASNVRVLYDASRGGGVGAACCRRRA